MPESLPQAEYAAVQSQSLQMMLGRLGLSLRIDNEVLCNVARKAGASEANLDTIDMVVMAASADLRGKGLVTGWPEVEPEDTGTLLPRYRYRQQIIIGITEDDAKQRNGSPADLVAAQAMQYAGKEAALSSRLLASHLPVLAVRAGAYAMRAGLQAVQRRLQDTSRYPDGVIDVSDLLDNGELPPSIFSFELKAGE